MKLIDQFYCIQTEKYGDGSERIVEEEIVSIKQELKRPSIRLIDQNYDIAIGQNRTIFRKKLLSNPYINTNESFSKEELFFLSQTYQFDIAEHPEYKGFFSSVLKIHPLYKSSADIILIEENNKQYLRIEFNRWEFENQPRSAGEDALGENITYVLGIWENPLLTDQIITKIKN